MAKPKKVLAEVVVEDVLPEVSDDTVGVKLRDGSIKLGVKKVVNGFEHVALEENGVETLVHKSQFGDWYEV